MNERDDAGTEPPGTLLLASHNEHKRREFSRLLGGLTVAALPDSVRLPPEHGSSYAENALLKARSAAQATGQPAVADDSGIEADALGGAPGVFSARYAGSNASDAENLERLRREVPPGSALTYVCLLAYVDATRGVERVFVGRCSGRMAAQARGSRGFGYDPVFVPDEDPGAGHGPERTMAELQDAEKDAISHRGRAARALAAWLAAR